MENRGQRLHLNKYDISFKEGQMELSWLYSIPRTVFLDRFFLFFTQLPGAIGQLWLIVGIVLLFFKRTRKTGAAVLVSYIGVLLFGELLLKHVVTRMRPCQIDQTFAMLVERPTSSSFPSTHSAFAFGTAMAIFMNHRRAGVLMFIVATLVAFSRLYLFVHFPTDVLCGIVLGIVVGFAAARICDFVEKKMQKENS
jgi:undecaprenyl-diphosphatase